MGLMEEGVAEQKMMVLGKTRCFSRAVLLTDARPSCRDAPEAMADLASLGSAEVRIFALKNEGT